MARVIQDPVQTWLGRRPGKRWMTGAVRGALCSVRLSEVGSDTLGVRVVAEGTGATLEEAAAAACNALQARMGAAEAAS